MKILFVNWLRWVFPKNKNPLKDFLKEKGVECLELQPCEIGHSNRALLIPNQKINPVLVHRGFKVDNFIKVESVMDEGWYNPKLSILIKYRKWVMYLIDWAFKTFKEVKPDYIVVEGGLTYLARTMVEVARELGIKIIAVENCFIKDKIFIDFSTGYIVNRHLFGRTSQDWLDTRVLTRQKEKEVNEMIKNTFENLNYPTKGKFNTEILKHPKTVVVPLQVFADQVTLYDSEFNNEQFINKIFELARGPFRNWNFILKCHPKEEKNKPKATGDWIMTQSVPNNVLLIRGAENSVNTQDLLRSANLVMVNTSQAGLEACLLGKPVVVFGDAFYAKKGFTIDYNKSINWLEVEKNYMNSVNIKGMKMWFYYFYRSLFSKPFSEEDKKRIASSLNLKLEK